MPSENGADTPPHPLLARLYALLPALRQTAWDLPKTRVIFLTFLALFTLAYGYVCALQIGQVNQNRASSDQQAGLELARESRGDLLPGRTNGVANPLWPWLAGKTVVSAEPDEDAAAFLKGKWLNTGLTLAFCVGLGLWAAWKLPLLPAMSLTALCGFGAMAQRAPFFQPEPLFYIFFFLSTAVGAAILIRNTLPRYAIFGALCGLCYLAKASITPFLGIVLALASAAAILCLWPRLLFFWPALPKAMAEGGFSWKRHWIGLVACLAAFGIIILPRAVYSQREFGDPLHSFPKYWMWQDDFETESTNFMIHWEELRDDAKSGGQPLPSAGVYLKEHGIDHFKERLIAGSTNAFRNFAHPEKRPPWAKKSKKPKPWEHVLQYRGYYLGALTLWAAVLGISVLAQRPRLGQGIPQAPVLLALGLGSFVAYTLAYGLYEVIGKGDRFMLSLYVPVVVGLIFAERRFLRELPGRWPWFTSGLIHLAIVWAICARLGEVTRFPFFKD
jgi:hypothetical protein